MVADIITTDQTSQYIIGPTAFVALMPDVSLTIEADTSPGFLANHDDTFTLTVLGTVVTFGTAAQLGATSIASAFAAVTVGETGLLQSLTGYGIDFRRSGTRVDNDGAISGGNAAIRYAASVDGGTVLNAGTLSSIQGSAILVTGATGGGTPGLFSVVNTGLIEAMTHGVSVAAESLLLSNHGEIVASGIGVSLTDDPSLDNSLTLVNTGLIRGRTSAVTATGHADVITNHGTLVGAVLLGDGANLFDNSGTTDGAVSAGAGVDRFTNTGVVTGTVSLGGETDWVVNLGRLEAGLDLGEGDDRLTNEGTILGDVLLGAGGNSVRLGGSLFGDLLGGGNADSVAVLGLVSGDVTLGDGADTLAIEGRIEGDVDMGTGTDTLRLRAAAVETAGSLDGGSGDDVLIASVDVEDCFNFETITLKGGADLGVEADAIDNTITGNRGDNELAGNGGADLIFGGSGDDVLIGGSDADELRGNRGADELHGGIGADTLRGGRGRDSFVYEALAESRKTSPDHILDFETGRDTVDVSELVAGTVTWLGTDRFSKSGVAEARYSLDGDDLDLRIDLDGDGKAEMAILFEDIARLRAGDFDL